MLPNSTAKGQPMSGKQKPPKPLREKPESQAPDAELMAYFSARKVVLEREVGESLRIRDFRRIEHSFYDYGEFLERHPAALREQL